MLSVAVTGGSGVVGKAVIRHLVADGHQVKALARSGSSAEALSSLGATPQVGDLLEVDTLRSLVRGCAWVFNVAGVNQMCVRDPSHMERVNVSGVRNVLAACRSEGVARLVHTSSAVTIGEAQGTVATERSPHRGFYLSEYERTKHLGELALFEDPGDVEVVAVNPSSVQGPGRATGTGKLILDVVNGELRWLVDTTISLVDIDDCARGHLLAAANGRPGTRYLLNGGTLGIRDAIAVASAASGRYIPVRMVPAALAGAAVAVSEPVSRLLGIDLPYCREMVRVLTFGHRYDGSAAGRELGLEYRTIQETIRRTIAWFEDQGLLDR